MNTITFNKNYTKLPASIKTAVLVAAEPVRMEEQEQAFLNYDTHYAHCEYPKMGAYNYPKIMTGEYLCLVLKSDSGAIFTTLRKDNSENREKYMKKIEGMPYSFNLDNELVEMTGCLYIPRYNEKFQIIIKEG